MGDPYQRASDGRWVAAIEAGWTARGTRRRVTVSAATKRECLQKLRAKEREIARSGVGSEGQAPGVTVKSWSEAWLAMHVRDVRPTSFSADRSQVKNWIVPAIGHKRLDRLSPGDIRVVRRAILDADLEPGTATRAHAVLKKMLADASAEGHHVPTNVLATKGMGTTTKQGRDRGVIEASHAALLLAEAARRDDGARWMVALLEGVRPSEALGLTWGALDFEARTITIEWQLRRLPYNVARDRSSGFRVPDGYEARRLHDAVHLVRPKTDSGFRVIPMLEPVAQALERWRKVAPASKHDLVFPDADGKGRDDKADRAAWKALTDALEVRRRDGERYELYECRHTTASVLLAAGVDNATIVAIMGHASILSTQAYLHTDLERARAELTRATAHLLEP